jgi:predicted transcriptional regulator
MDWETISYVTSNKIRFSVLVSLKNKSKTPTAISKDINFPLTHTSTALKNLEEKKLVKCLTPSSRKNKFYSITEVGKEILKKISKETELLD